MSHFAACPKNAPEHTVATRRQATACKYKVQQTSDGARPAQPNDATAPLPEKETRSHTMNSDPKRTLAKKFSAWRIFLQGL
jgi:hypothetical protein